MKAVKEATKSIIKILCENDTARKLELNLPTVNRTLFTPNYIMSSKGQKFLVKVLIIYRGALNGVIKHNLKDIDYQTVALNFPDMHEYIGTLEKFQEHLEKEKKDETKSKNPLKRYFNYNDKITMLTPFAYSMDKEKMSGFNDDVHFQVNNRHKVNVQKYFDFAVQNQPDFIVSPCEQVTFTSGKQKRKRSQKAALKNFINFQKIVKQEDKNQMLLMPILLGDKDGLDNYEMRQIQQRFIDEDEDKSLYYQGKLFQVIGIIGFMIYGTDQLVQPAAYSEMKQFFNTMPKEKIRAHHGMGTPVDVLNGIISGIDLFESDYPLTMAERGIAILIEDVKIQRKEESQQGEDRDDYLFLEMSKMMQKKDQRTLVLSKEENKTSEEKLVKECECYTCKNYNRGYLYHLLEVKEMNANILIAIHNVHQYHRMFENIRENFDDLEGYFKEYVKVNCVDIEESQLVSNENA